MLDRIALENFKSWESLDLRLGKVTAFFGTNSSGKSSIIQFLLMLKKTKESSDRDICIDFGSSGDFINFGSYKDIVFQHNPEKSMSWTIDWKLPKELSIANPSGPRNDIIFRGKELSLHSKVRNRKEILRAEKLKYKFDNSCFEISPKKDDSTEFEIRSNSDTHPSYEFTRNKGRAWSLPGPIKTHLFPDQAKTYYQNADFLSDFEVEYESLIEKIYYLGPLREHPKREYQWSGASPRDVGIRGERTVDAILSATRNGEKRNLGGRTHYKKFQEMIAHWLKELGLIDQFNVEEIAKGSNLFRAKVRKAKGSPDTLLTDVGFGISQILPALVLLYYAPEGSIVIMEQPEIHLHPAVQSGLADVILKVAETRKIQVIVESHSEHLLRRMQRNVAEDNFSANDIKIYFCELKNGKSTLSDLKLNVYGEIENWPDNFFGDEFGEISAIQKASLKRKIKENKKQ